MQLKRTGIQRTRLAVPAGFFMLATPPGTVPGRADLSFSLQGALRNAAKEEKTMSEDRVLETHSLTIRFDQLEGNRVNWYIEPDDEVLETQTLSLIDLAECGAPLAAMGIRALWKLCLDGLVYNSLEQANSIQAEVGKRLAVGPFQAELDLAPEGVTIN